MTGRDVRDLLIWWVGTTLLAAAIGFGIVASVP